ncbi:MAG TPA: VWA domain-containing protein, partial [Gemmataceae bacterium]|nr:VWA domain-containing protein [Gemmataceae bacterium]
FQPEGVENEKGGITVGLEGDRVQNNSATTHVVAMGQRRILVIEQTPGEHQLLVDRLKVMSNSKYKVHTITPSRLPESKDDLGVFLSNYDSVILANVPAEMINSDQQEMLRSNTRDQGCGFVMIGGPEGFGAGGWQGTPVEEALPVDCDIKSFKVLAKGGLVLIMHACELADGNRWEKEIAKLAIKKLSPNDEIGIIGFDWGGHKWHLPLQEIRNRQRAMFGIVDRMTPGDMPDFDTPLKMAYDSLTESKRQLATKHIIVITDGDPQLSNYQLLASMKKAGVSLTTVGVATHGVNEDGKLREMAAKASRGGSFHKVISPKALPAIYIKETRLVSQSFVATNRFVPQLLLRGGPTEKLPERLNPLYGYVRTTPKQSPLVEIAIGGPQLGEQEFPILAYWHYGLGKAIAFTSDARSQPGRPAWDRDWASSDIYSKFWEQVVEWSLRPTETGRMTMMTEYNDGKVKVIVDARDDNNRPLTDLILRGGVTSPMVKDERKQEVKFEQRASGIYEAEFKSEEAGSYFVNAQAIRQVKTMEKGKEVVKDEAYDSVRSGVTIPYSPEFSDLESNTALMERLRDMTGGTTLSEDLLARAADLKDPASETVRGELAENVFRSGLPQFKNLQPVWFWLVFLTGVGLFFDIAVRRIAVQPAEVAGAAQRVWGRLRGRAQAAEQTPQFIDRLKSRKAQVSEALEQLRAARRFEGGERVTAAPPGTQETVAAPSRPAGPRPAPQQRLAPETQQEPQDYASRLLKAKRRVWQEREEPEK